MERDNYWDILKGLGIMAIVLGHTGAPIVQYLNMYHIVLFFFVSGYLYNDKYSLHPKEFIRTRVRRLLYPFLMYNIIILFLHNTLLRLNLYSTDPRDGIFFVPMYGFVEILHKALRIMVLNGTEPLVAPMWFVIPFFIVNILFLLIRNITIRYFKKTDLLITAMAVTSAFVAGFYVNYRGKHIICFLDVASICLAIFLMGYMVQRIDLKKYILGLQAALCVLLLIYICSNYGTIALGSRSFNKSWVFLVGSFTGIYANLYVSSLIQKNKHLSAFFVYIGKRSFSIMALNFISFKVMNLIYIIIHQAPMRYLERFPVITWEHYWWAAYLAAGIAIPVFIDFIWDNLISHYKISIRHNEKRAEL